MNVRVRLRDGVIHEVAHLKDLQGQQRVALLCMSGAGWWDANLTDEAPTCMLCVARAGFR